jgi:Clr5 domain
MAASGTFLPRFDAPKHPSPTEWASFKELIIQLYIHEDKSLNEVQKYLLDSFNFDGT